MAGAGTLTTPTTKRPRPSSSAAAAAAAAAQGGEIVRATSSTSDCFITRVVRMWTGMTRLSIILLFLLLLIAAWPEDTIKIPLPMTLLAWSLVQWTPSSFLPPFLSRNAQKWQEKCWSSWEEQQADAYHYNKDVPPLAIPTIDFGDPTVAKDPWKYLQTTYGKDWRERPLLLKAIWNATALQDPHRRLSPHGLTKETMTIPYFTDARVYGALTPDAEAPIHHIVDGMLHEGHASKIASQLFVQAHPSVLSEVAPPEILIPLFGDRFSKERLLGHIQSPWALLQGPLTVPLFVASIRDNSGKGVDESSEEETSPTNTTEAATCQQQATKEGDTVVADSTTCQEQEQEQQLEQYDHDNWNTTSSSSSTSPRPFTGLHCEPIGNVAVQLAGVKQWTLIEPQYSHLLRPAVAPDSRGYFASWATSVRHVPRYQGVQTQAGDAVWVPPWTWHRVDYYHVPPSSTGEGGEDTEDDATGTTSSDSTSLAIGASLFHFRPLAFVRRNPLYALLLFPYLVGEFIGSKSQ